MTDKEKLLAAIQSLCDSVLTDLTMESYEKERRLLYLFRQIRNVKMDRPLCELDSENFKIEFNNDMSKEDANFHFEKEWEKNRLYQDAKKLDDTKLSLLLNQ